VASLGSNILPANMAIVPVENTPDEIAYAKYEEEYPEELRKILTSLTESLEVQQKSIREVNIKEWKQLDFYWKTLQNIYWSDTDLDWRPYEGGIALSDIDINENDIGKIVNVYKAYGESIIAALSTSLPGVRFSPDDADNPDDIATAKAYGKIANLIHLHNNSNTLFVRALFILFNQSFVALYNYHNTSPEYGTVKTPKNELVPTEVENLVCPNCATDLNEAPVQDHEFEGQSFQSSECPTCVSEVIPDREIETVHRLITTYEDCPKGREILEVYGPMNVQVPFYVQRLKDSPYLILETEHHISLAKALFPHLASKITTGGSAYSSYERWARQPSEAFGTQDVDLVTFRRVWLRPTSYYMIAQEDQREALQEKYPTGLYFLLLNDLFAEAYEENMDDHWTITESPTSMYIHDAPMGRVLRDVQDMTNDMANLTLRTILYGIPMTFADSNVIDWDKFSETPTEPGMVYPVKGMPGQNLDGMFHTVKTATLSKEVDSFTDRLSGIGQFVSGANAAIFGGALEGGSDTAKEYETRRNQALQRLSLPWKMLNTWWKDATFKSAKEFARNLLTDQAYPKRTGESYINVWIKKAEMQGKVGDVESESSDQFPISEVQRRSLILQLLESPAPAVQQFFSSVIANPENIGLVTRLLGFGELYIPGDDQRNKQLAETIQLMVAEPVPTGQIQMDETGIPVLDANGQPQQVLTSSIPVEDIDDHPIHAEVTKAFLVSDQGQYLKNVNPAGYQNLMLHYQEHEQVVQMQAQQQMQQQALMEKSNAGGKPEPDKQPV
jgi:hypothetical protein